MFSKDNEPQKRSTKSNGRFIPKADLCRAYDLTPRALNDRIKHIIDINRKKFFSPKEVKVIFDELGPADL